MGLMGTAPDLAQLIIGSQQEFKALVGEAMMTAAAAKPDAPPAAVQQRVTRRKPSAI